MNRYEELTANEERDQAMKETIREDAFNALTSGKDYSTDELTVYYTDVIGEIESDIDSDDWCLMLLQMSKKDDAAIDKFIELLESKAEELIEIGLK